MGSVHTLEKKLPKQLPAASENEVDESDEPIKLQVVESNQNAKMLHRAERTSRLPLADLYVNH